MYTSVFSRTESIFPPHQKISSDESLRRSTIRLFIRKWLLVLMTSLLACLVQRVAAEAPPASLQFVRLMSEQGLSVGSVEVIYQDHLGYMWFGGTDGLVQYDGYSFVIYRNKPNDNTSLSSNIIWDIHEDKTGKLWIATDIGINLFNRSLGNFTYFLHDNAKPDSLVGNSTRSIAEDAAGNLWIATIDGLSKFNKARTSFTNFRYAPNNPATVASNEIRKILMDRDGTTLWIGHYSRGLNRLNTLTNEFTHYKFGVNDGTGLSHANLVSIFQDRDGFLWLGTDGGGLNRFNPAKNEFTYFAATPGNPHALSHAAVAAITDDEQGNLWIATEGGLNYLDRQTLEFNHYFNVPNQKNSLASSNVHSVFVDSNHDLWAGNFPTGVNFLDTSNMVFRTYRNDPNNTNSLSNSSVLAIDEFPAGTFWLGTDGGGLNRFDLDKETFTRYEMDPKNPESMHSRAILSVQHMQDGSLWMGAWHGGLNHFNPATGETKQYNFSPNPGSLSNDNVWSLCDDLQKLWVGSIGGGVDTFSYDTRTFTNYHTQYKTNVNFFVAWKIFKDHKGQIWVGTNDGLGRYLPAEDKFIFYRHDPKDPDTISFDAVLDITEDTKQQLWIATRGGGLNLFDSTTEKFKHYRESDGLPDDVIRSVKADNLGNLWLGSARGLTQFNPTTKKVVTYNENNGLQGNMFNFASGLKTSRGEMIFGGTGGFTIFDPAKLKSNDFVPPVAIVDFQIFNKPVVLGAADSPLTKVISETDEITLTYRQTVFSFSFSALSYRNSEKNKFAYIMEGFEKEWNYVGNDRRIATYTNLNPGTYNFKVKASNNEGLWNETGRSIKIHILPPPWKTWWAYIIYCLIFAGLLYAFANSQRKKVLSEQKINKRLQQLDKLKDEFLANTSHELRTPLNGIIGLAESLRDGVGGVQSEVSKSNLEMIVSSGKRLERLVNAILDFSKLKEHSLTLFRKAVDLHATTEVVLALSQPSLVGKDIKLINAITKDIPLVSADEDRVQQILHNLIGNAIKFTDKGSVVVSAKVIKDQLQICVEDTGIGVAAEDADFIFDSFHQVEGATERQHSGTGLGLTVTKQLVELHGGNIFVKSTPGIGSAFYFTLPLLADYEAAQAQAGQTASLPGLPVAPESRQQNHPEKVVSLYDKPGGTTASKPKSFQILIVDDEPINRQVLMNHLSLQNYQVISASGGQEALDIVNAQHIDLMVLDIMMPSMSGYDVCKQIRNRFSSHELPIIFLTAKTQINDLVTGFTLGANDFLTKPINRDELLARVSTHLQLLEITRTLEKKVGERTEELQQKHKLLEEAYLQLEKISLSDPLTGLSNRRYLQKLIPMDVAKVQREYDDKIFNRAPRKTSLDLAFFLLDVDYFKSVNDIHGHAAGDQLLIQLSGLLTRVCRETDCLVRWGGEEFLIVSRFSDRDEAPLMAERIRKAVAQHEFKLSEGLTLQKTCSIGFASYPFMRENPGILSWEQVIDTADHALYAAKRSGRNRSVGLIGNSNTPQEDLYRHISDDLSGMIERDELKVIASDLSGLLWK